MRVNRLLGIITLVALCALGVWFVTTDFSDPTNAASSPETAAAVPQRGMAPAAQSESGTAPLRDAGPIVGESVAPTISEPVSSLPVVTGSTATLEREINPRQNPSSFLSGNVTLPRGERDTLADVGVNGGTSPTPTLVFEGISYAEAGDGFPPDTVGDVGPNHYIQAINVAFQIFDKSGNSLGGPFDIGDLWTQGICAGLEFGDPIVIYDELADRWTISQFYSNGICMAVSQTPDPLGTYYLYNFSTPDFPDYFKISVWPNAYYMGANESSYTAYAIDRNAMLAGQPVTTIRFAGQTNLLLPADVDGSVGPAADAPGIFYTFKDSTYHGGGSDRLEIFELDPDFVTPANSTFQLVTTIPVSEFTYTVCGFFNFNCIRQPGTSQRVDAVSEWPMWRLAYRNFGTHESLVGNFAVDVGSEVSGIRWFELRKLAAAPYTLYQEGTYAPDGDSRFMGSIAQDQQGNIALGYNVSSTTTYPSLRYAVRSSDDPLGTLRTEAVILNGNASQTNANRWGDYSAMSIDPADDCTFWFTGEMMPLGGGNWTTQIGSFALDECAAPTAVTLNTLNVANESSWLWVSVAGLLAVAGIVLARKR
jgi:hypothetical protein